MIKIENVDVYGWEAAIRGMRNPMNSWDKSDSAFVGRKYRIGEKDLELMRKLAKAGADHGKFLRMIVATLDIVAPLYWWKEFDTYKVGTVANSCSTMHKLDEWHDFCAWVETLPHAELITEVSDYRENKKTPL